MNYLPQKPVVSVPNGPQIIKKSDEDRIVQSKEGPLKITPHRTFMTPQVYKPSPFKGSPIS